MKRFMRSMLIESDIPLIERIIKRLGGEISTCPGFDSAATHLIINQTKSFTTEKLLCSLAAGKTIVTDAYIKACGSRNEWLDEKLHPFNGSVSHKDVLLKLQLDRLRNRDVKDRTPPFRGWTVCIVIGPKHKNDEQKPKCTHVFGLNLCQTVKLSCVKKLLAHGIPVLAITEVRNYLLQGDGNYDLYAVSLEFWRKVEKSNLSKPDCKKGDIDLKAAITTTRLPSQQGASSMAADVTTKHTLTKNSSKIKKLEDAAIKSSNSDYSNYTNGNMTSIVSMQSEQSTRLRLISPLSSGYASNYDTMSEIAEPCKEPNVKRRKIDFKELVVSKHRISIVNKSDGSNGCITTTKLTSSDQLTIEIERGIVDGKNNNTTIKGELDDLSQDFSGFSVPGSSQGSISIVDTSKRWDFGLMSSKNQNVLYQKITSCAHIPICKCPIRLSFAANQTLWVMIDGSSSQYMTGLECFARHLAPGITAEAGLLHFLLTKTIYKCPSKMCESQLVRMIRFAVSLYPPLNLESRRYWLEVLSGSAPPRRPPSANDLASNARNKAEFLQNLHMHALKWKENVAQEMTKLVGLLSNRDANAVAVTMDSTLANSPNFSVKDKLERSIAALDTKVEIVYQDFLLTNSVNSFEWSGVPKSRSDWLLCFTLFFPVDKPSVKNVHGIEMLNLAIDLLNCSDRQSQRCIGIAIRIIALFSECCRLSQGSQKLRESNYQNCGHVAKIVAAKIYDRLAQGEFSIFHVKRLEPRWLRLLILAMRVQHFSSDESIRIVLEREIKYFDLDFNELIDFVT